MLKTPENLIQSIQDKLDHFQIKLDNRKSELDYYILAETLLIPLLNKLFDCHLQNANKTRSNIAGIDLIDPSRRISFQITRQTGMNKVKETLEKTIQYHRDKYGKVYIIFLAKKQQGYAQEPINAIINGNNLEFNVHEHLLDISDISGRIKYLATNPEKLIEIEKHLIYVLSGKEDNDQTDDKMKDLERFIQTRYIAGQYMRFPFDQQLARKYSEMFSYICTLEGAIEPKNYSSDNLFDICLRHVIETTSENPLVITGPPGSGKSTFLSLFYKFICSKLTPEIYAAIPIYINLQHYFEETSGGDALGRLKVDIDRIKEYLPSSGEELIMILDGNDDSFRYSMDTANQLISLILREFSVKKKIIGMNIGDNNFFMPMPGNNLYSFTSDAESRLTLQTISIYNKNFNRIIDLYAELNHNPISADKSDQFEKYLKDKIAQYKILRVDFFMLYIFCEKKNMNYRNCKTLSDFYKQFCFDKLRDTTDNNLLEISNIAFDFYIKKVIPQESNMRGWSLIHTHLSIRDYLLAFQIVFRLRRIGGMDKNSPKEDYECFNFVYTDSINNFCKEIMNADPQTQKYVSDGIYKIFKKVELTAQTHFCYLLGRFNSSNQKEHAHQYLNLLLEQIDKSNNKKGHKNQSIENQYLLYFRTIYISLIYLGDKTANNKYLQRLLDDPQWNSINRGFHREYYGDIPFDPGLQSLTLEDNVEEEFSNTFTKLYRKLNESLIQAQNYNLFEIELFTLCSLAQHRQVHKNGKITSEQISAINKLIQRAIDVRRVDPGKPIGKYIEFLIDNFSEDKFFPLGKLFSRIYNIKNEDRAGWKKRGLRDTEKVSSHLYGGWLIGKICLPDIVPEMPDYDKGRILDMILIHDLGEAIVGDKTPDEKTAEHKKNERRAIESTSMFSTYFGNKLSDIATNFKDFESKNDDDINIAVANDLDKLDNLMQLYTYVHTQKMHVPDYDRWVNDLIGGLKSDPGKKIMQMMVDFFETFSDE